MNKISIDTSIENTAILQVREKHSFPRNSCKPENKSCV